MTEQHHPHPPRANPEAPVTNIVIYIPRKGREAELLALIRRHEPALRGVGLVTDEPFRVWRRATSAGSATSSSSSSRGRTARPATWPTRRPR